MKTFPILINNTLATEIKVFKKLRKTDEVEYDVVKLKRFEKSVTSIIEAMNFRFEDLETKCLFKRISF